MKALLLALSLALGVALPWGVCQADEAFDPVKVDERVLAEAKQPTDGPGLLALLKQWTLGDTDRERIKSLIEALGSDNFKAREKATGDLILIGPPATALLQQAQKSDD